MVPDRNICENFLSRGDADNGHDDDLAAGQMKQWIERQVEAGSYSSASDYVRDLVRRDREGRERNRVYSIDELCDLLADARADRSGGMTVDQVRQTGRRIAQAGAWPDSDG